MKNKIISLSILVLLSIHGSVFSQQAYPNRPIRMIVPYASGGSTDSLARAVAPKLSAVLGQNVIVDTRPGGNATIGSEALIKSAPDGYTLMMTAVDHVIIPQLMHTSYDPVNDFMPVSGVSFTQLILIAHPSLPANNLQELISLAKAKPGLLNYSTSGKGGVPHLTGEMFNASAAIKIQHIPYKGGAPAIIDTIAGQVQLSLAIPITASVHIKSGKVKAIAITGVNRLDTLPQVPTFTEGGVPGFDVKTWYAIFAPVGTPKSIIDKLSSEIRKVVLMPEIKEKWATLGMEPFPTLPEELGEIIRSDFNKYGKIIKDGNIKIDN